MKIQQIEYAVEVSKTLSFSAAAENLYVSQPNISRSISLLEEELGYKIFLRTNQGITLTEEGEFFIQHADIIVEQLNLIKCGQPSEEACSLHIKSSFNHTSISEAYIKLCKYYDSCRRINLFYGSGTVKEIINDLYLNKIQLGIICLDNKALKLYTQMAKSKDLTIVPLTKINLNINLRKNHPVLKEGIKNFNFQNLKDYVHIFYDINMGEEFPTLLYNDFFDSDKTICVNEKETRRKLVSSTNAFSIGCNLHPKTLKDLNWVNVPIPKVYCNLLLVKKNSWKLNEEAEKFIGFIKKELTYIE